VLRDDLRSVAGGVGDLLSSISDYSSGIISGVVLRIGDGCGLLSE